jgi:hypothetical protein
LHCGLIREPAFLLYQRYTLLLDLIFLQYPASSKSIDTNNYTSPPSTKLTTFS